MSPNPTTKHRWSLLDSPSHSVVNRPSLSSGSTIRRCQPSPSPLTPPEPGSAAGTYLGEMATNNRDSAPRPAAVQSPGSFAPELRREESMRQRQPSSSTTEDTTNRTLVPQPATQFPGSFAPDLRQDHRKYSKRGNWSSVLYYYFTDGWDNLGIWKSAFIEFVGTAMLCYLSGLIHTTIGSFDTLQPAGYVGVTNIFLLTLFIYALAPSSGGHVNPMITLATMTGGLTGFSRGMLYMTGQIAGAALAGGLLRGSFGRTLTIEYQGGGCYLNSSVISAGQAYLIESVSSFMMLFLSFGVGLDPRQAKVFGPKLGPFLVACSLGLLSFSSVGLGEGYPGASMNPTRCFAFAVARGEFRYQWIWWLGPFTGCLVQTAVYYLVPPYHRGGPGQIAEAAAAAREDVVEMTPAENWKNSSHEKSA